MKIKCLGCGTEKDTDVEEPYPYPEDDILCEGPIDPLFVLECQPETKGEAWRVGIVCHQCFKKLQPDMWIGEKCWISINPVVPFDKLPLNNLPNDTETKLSGKWNPESYFK